MKLKHLHVKNFMSIGSIEIDLDKPGLNLVLGKNLDDKRFDSNGAAKSALFEALTWGLYGQLLRPLLAEEVIRTGSTKLEVNVLVDPEDGTEPVWFKRSRFKAKGHYINVETASGKSLFPANSVKDIQEQIDSWLGLDFRTFTNSVYFGKGLVKFFMSASDNDRKELLETILQLVSFDKALEAAKEDVKSISADIIETEREKGIAEALNIEKHTTITLYNNSLKAITKQRDEELPEIEKVLASSQKARDLGLNVINTLTEKINILNKEYKKKIKNADDSFERVKSYNEEKADDELLVLRTAKEKVEKDTKENFDKSVVEVIKKRDNIAQEHTSLLEKRTQGITELKLTDNEIFTTEKKISDTKALGPSCNSCGQIINDSYKNKVLTDLYQKLDNLKLIRDGTIFALGDLEKKIINLGKELLLANKALESTQAGCKDALLVINEQYREKREKINIEKSNMIFAQMETLTKVKNKYEQEHNDLIEDKWKLQSATTEEVGRINLAIQQLEATKKAIETSFESCSKNVQNLNDDIERIENTIKDCENKKKIFLKQKELSEFWVEGFGSKGIKSFIFETSLPYLTERANMYSSYLTGGTVTIDILPTTMVKSTGNLKEKLFIQARNKIGANVYDGNSDGERRRIDICVLLALQDLISTRATKTWNTIIFDEVMDALDKTGTEHVIDLFRTFKGKSIYIISHSSDLKSHFDTSIIIQKNKGVSSLL
jgi:DNA repair exonuclease SbcCD ATPase subunit